MPENNRPDYWVDAPDHASYQDAGDWETFIPAKHIYQKGYRCFTDVGLARHNTEIAITAFKEIADNMQPDEIINESWLRDLITTLEAGLA